MTDKNAETKKLYYEDSRLQAFTATVTACEPGKEPGSFQICLNQTAFFPEGGGQAGDTGKLNDIEVLDTQEKDGSIWHCTRAPLEPGAPVAGSIDWDKRFSRMQQHSGEHIVSGLVHARFGYRNVGFHLGERDVTLDFDGPISREELLMIETAANQAVFANLPVETAFPSPEELKALDYRSKIEIEGPVRIVTIPGVDVCACCAPHVAHTGEIGLIKLTDLKVHRGGVRLTMQAGLRALMDYREKETSVHAVSVLLSAKETQLVQAVERLKQENYELNGRLMDLQMTRIQEKALSLPDHTETAIFFEEHLDAASMRELTNLLVPRCRMVCVFTGNDETGYRYVLGSASADVRPLCRRLNETFQGKGGGKPGMVQGSLYGTEKAIRDLL